MVKSCESEYLNVLLHPQNENDVTHSIIDVNALKIGMLRGR